RFEVRAQLRDVVVHGAGDRVLVVTPYVAEQLLAAHHLVAVRQQIAEQLELACRERHAPRPAEPETLAQTACDVPERELLARHRVPVVAPYLRADPGEQLADAEGFADVVVGAQIEAAHAVALLCARRQHDDGHAGAASAQPLAYLEAAHAR